MKKKGVIFLLIFTTYFSFAQDYSTENTSLANFLKRMYNQTVFEGVKVVEDYNNTCLISVLALERSKYNNASTMNRVAQVKARQQASVFLNGSTITSDLVIRTSETKKKNSTETIVETVEHIREHSVGFVQGMELLINFVPIDTCKMVFIYSRKMEVKKE